MLCWLRRLFVKVLGSKVIIVFGGVG